MGKINVFVKLPGRAPYTTHISDSLENLQNFVDGPLEVSKITTDFAIICNEEGKLRGLDPNCVILGQMFVGNLIFIGISGEDFADVPIEFSQFKNMFNYLWEVDK